ncbi:MAG: hypothetical protein KC457_03010 [Myxococcales bacterium]|nr:hypothetical protein [Myxococcales bacterium]
MPSNTGAIVTPKQQFLTVAGVPLTEGRAKGDWLRAVYNLDGYLTETGIDGEGWFVEVLDDSAVVEASFTHVSWVNDFLGSLYFTNRNSSSPAPYPLTFNEGNGSTDYSTPRALIAKPADGVWSDGAQVRTWRFVIPKLRGYPGQVRPAPQLSAEAAAALLLQIQAG